MTMAPPAIPRHHGRWPRWPSSAARPRPGDETPGLGCGRSRHLEPEQLRAGTVRRALVRSQQLRGIRPRLRHVHGGHQCRAGPGDRSSSRPLQRRREWPLASRRRRRPREPPSPSGVAAGVLCVVAGLLLPDPAGPVFVALGIALPGLAVQDSWRFAFFAGGRGSSAFLNDLFWTVLLVSALVGLHRQGEAQRGAVPARLRRHRHDRCRAGRGAGPHVPPPAPRSAMAAHPLRPVVSISARERQHQRGVPDPFLRAGRSRWPRGRRSRAGV